MLNRFARGASLRALIAANAGKGAPLAVSVKGDAATVEIYDFIVSSEADARWYGGGVAADKFARELRGLDVGTIDLRINSPGGDVFAGVAMAQAIREHRANVVAHVDGYAASIASLLTVAADEAVIAPGGMVMIHKAWTIALGNADDFAAAADLLGKIDADLAEAYAAKAGPKHADTDWLAAMAGETWYRAEEAVAAGLVDRMADAPKKAAAAARAFDLSAYRNAPALAAPEPEPAPANDSEPDPATVADDIARRQRLHAVRSRFHPA